MRATDQMLTRLAGEIAEKQTFIDGVVEAAENDGRDLTSQEMELVTRARDRQGALNEQAKPMQEAAQIALDSRQRLEQIGRLMGTETERRPAEVSYRSAGAYVLDVWKSRLGGEEATARLETYLRAASHQTTTDNPGLLPEQILGPVIDFVDHARPLSLALGIRNLPGGTWSRPRVTQHTQVAAQGGEKTELVSRKMTISKLPVTATTYGGYVNISRQDIDWTQPEIMDIVIADLAGIYAEVTEAALCAAVDAATTAGPVLLTGPTTNQAVANAIWTAAGQVYAAVKGAGRLIVLVSPDMLGLVGPLFAPVSPTNAQSTGFEAGQFGSGAIGAISGIQVVMSPGADAGTIIVLSTAAAEVYEDRVGPLSVVEPSVLGVQVAYAGYFAPLVIEPLGIIEITKTP